MTDFVAGIDGGGSKTLVILAYMEGNHLADVVGGGSAMAPGRGDHSAEVIASLVRMAMNEAGINEGRPRILVAGVAGVGRLMESRALAGALEDLEIADEVVVQETRFLLRQHEDSASPVCEPFEHRSSVYSGPIVPGTPRVVV